MPCAGCATAWANGMPGSTQLRLTATSVSAPSMRSSASHSTVSGRGRLAEVAQQPAPGAELHVGAAVEAADRRVEPLAQARLGRVVGIFELAAQHAGQAAQGRRPAGRARRRAARPPRPARRSAAAPRPRCRSRRRCRRRAPAPAAGPAPRKLSKPGRPRSSATRWCQPSAGRMRAATSASISALPAVLVGLDEVADAALQARGRASGRPRRRAASAAARAPPGPTAAPKRRCRRLRAGGGPRRRRSGSARCASSSPPSAACAMTSAWLATTSRACRAARTFFSTKQLRKCGQAEWTHSPRRSASAVDPAARRSARRASPGKSPATRSPASVAAIQRAISASCATDLPGRADGAAHRVLVIQQAEEILAALADDDAAALLHRVGVEPVELAGDLASAGCGCRSRSTPRPGCCSAHRLAGAM